MCGIAGILPYKEVANKDQIHITVTSMCDQMHARGPDAIGYWSDPSVGLMLGHRRLSILDLDIRSNQPMVSDDGRYVIVYNGEIYNFRELRLDLENAGEVFKTSGDTEVILKLYISQGEKMLTLLRGMFAFSIWDNLEKTLFMARDPYGIKPLYYCRNSDSFLFASQVKALLASGMVSKETDPVGQAGFWLMGSVPEPYTWFRDIRALPAGSWCKITADGKFTEPKKFWDIGDSWRQAPECHLSHQQVQEQITSAVRESVRKHLVSDVPVGIFLSGGIDSGSLAGLIKDVGADGIQGVTIAFSEFQGKHEDEVPVASEIARSYGIGHHVRTITKDEFQKDLPRILSAMDQPTLDGINTWYASKAVAELGLKVVVSGVGGDELFYGYPSFRQIPKLVSRYKQLSMIPGANIFLDLALSIIARKKGNNRWRWLTRQAGTMYGAYWLRRGLYTPDELPESIIDQIDPEKLIESMVGQLPNDTEAAVGQMESMVYLRNQLLRDSDWASMDHSVELRTPLVDAWLLRELSPVLRSFRRFNGKSMLAATPSVPLTRQAVDRVKTGFGIPLGAWMRGSIDVDGASVTQGGHDSRKWAITLSKAIYTS